MGPTRPTQVTCTLEVPRWSASSLRHFPPVRASTLDHCTQPSRLGAQREGTTSETSTTRRPRPPEGDEPQDQKAMNHRTKAPRRSTKPVSHEETMKKPPTTKRTTPTWRLVRPCIPPTQRLAPPNLLLCPPSSSCGNVPEGGVPPFQRFAPPHFWLRLPSSFCEKLLEKGRFSSQRLIP